MRDSWELLLIKLMSSELFWQIILFIKWKWIYARKIFLRSTIRMVADGTHTLSLKKYSTKYQQHHKYYYFGSSIEPIDAEK